MNKGSVTSVNTDQFMYVASYTYPNCAPGSSVVSKATGISVYQLKADGEIELIQTMQSENPSFITLNADKTVLYCVNELGVDDSSLDGRVSAYRIDPENGQLSFINTQLTNGNWPCHCSVHPSGKYLLSANYGSGNFVMHPILEDGSLGALTDQHVNHSNGLGADPGRQADPHPHMIEASPGGEHVFGVDLGTDKVYAWSIDLELGKFTPAPVPAAGVASGNGPRHMSFHPGNRFTYVLNELSSTIDVFDFYADRGGMIGKQSISLMPTDSDFTRPVFEPTNPGLVPAGTNTGGAICINEAGTHLYATNRGMNTVVVYRIDQETGKLTALDWVSTRGTTPRGMQIDGRHLYVGNQDSNNIVQFEINPATGLLDGKAVEIPCPVPTDFAFASLNR